MSGFSVAIAAATAAAVAGAHRQPLQGLPLDFHGRVLVHVGGVCRAVAAPGYICFEPTMLVIPLAISSVIALLGALYLMHVNY